MCSPLMLVTAVTAGAQLYQGYQANQQAKQQAKNIEEASAYNARIQENQATNTRNVGTEEENRQRRMTAELLSRQRAQTGASGVETDSGSALQLQEDTVELGEMDALRIRRNYQDEATAIEQGAALTRATGANDAYQTRQQGKSALIGGGIGAAGSVIGGMSGSVSNRWYGPKSAAVTTGGGSIHSNAYLRSLRV